jgi:hypothetical protein
MPQCTEAPSNTCGNTVGYVSPDLNTSSSGISPFILPFMQQVLTAPCKDAAALDDLSSLYKVL